MSSAPLLLAVFLLAFATSTPLQAMQENLPAKQSASNPTAEQMTFSFEPRYPEQPAWSITLDPDGAGTYNETSSPAADRPLNVREALRQRLQSAAAAVPRGHCETRQKGIAQTGKKTLTVVLGPGTAASCTFNYSDDESLNNAANAFLALAETFQRGAKLQRDHRFDRLALDADMQTFSAEVASGRALEPANIAPVLQSIADDERVIDRVRREAARLLQAGTDAASAR